jgi:hypothetical protein
MEAWKHAVANDPSADYVAEVSKRSSKKTVDDTAKAGTKRKAVSVEFTYPGGAVISWSDNFSLVPVTAGSEC